MQPETIGLMVLMSQRHFGFMLFFSVDEYSSLIIFISALYINKLLQVSKSEEEKVSAELEALLAREDFQQELCDYVRWRRTNPKAGDDK